MNIYLIFKNYNERIQNIIHEHNIMHDPTSSIALIVHNNILALYNLLTPKVKTIQVDFLSNTNNYRCLNFKKKNEALYKALGMKKNYFPIVIDATAGFGQDAFLISFWGCYVVMIERHPIIAALLKDGLQRAYENKHVGSWLKERLHLIFCDSVNIFKILTFQPDIIYLDPMYPRNKKNALPKKNMQFLRNIIDNSNNHNEHLLNISRTLVKKRVIVKRPSYAKPLSYKQLSFSVNNKNHRFDIYLPSKL